MLVRGVPSCPVSTVSTPLHVLLISFMSTMFSGHASDMLTSICIGLPQGCMDVHVHVYQFEQVILFMTPVFIAIFRLVLSCSDKEGRVRAPGLPCSLTDPVPRRRAPIRRMGEERTR